MTVRMVLASLNAGKVAEVQRILGSEGVRLVGMEALDLPEVAETGATFDENALLKARAAAEATGLPAVADDSGLCVDALNGMPGVLSARWSGRRGKGHDVDVANLDLLLAQIAEVPDDRRGAAFVCAAALALPSGRSVVCFGEVRGRLIRDRRGAGGFGYDPVFIPEGHHRTTAEMSPAEKDAISHRGLAFRALAERLPELLPMSAGPG